jgi:hypothetical protein
MKSVRYVTAYAPDEFLRLRANNLIEQSRQLIDDVHHVIGVADRLLVKQARARLELNRFIPSRPLRQTR